jgi:hypothetical protein
LLSQQKKIHLKKFLDILLGSFFFFGGREGQDLKAQETSAENRHVQLHQTKKIVGSKRKQQGEQPI